MPIDSEKVGDSAGRISATALGEGALKNFVTEELLQAIAKLSADKKLKVADFVNGLSAMMPSNNHTERNLSSAELAAIEEESERLCDMGKDLGPFDVLALMKDLRR